MGFIINGENVDDEVIEEEFDAIKQHYQNLGEVVCCDRDEEFMNYARDNVLNRTLLQQQSVKEYGAPEDAEIDAMIAKLKEEHGGEEAFYQNTGYNPQDEFKIRRKVGATISVDKVIAEAVGEEPDPTDEELRAWYEEHIDRYLSPEEVSAAHIFKEPKSQQDMEDQFAELREVRQRLLDGEDFDKIAVEVSDKKEPDEINLGFFKRGDLMHEIEIIAFSMNQDEISPVIATHFGLHLIKKTGSKKPEPMPFEEIRDQVAEAFVTERREGRINACIGKLKEAAEIEETEPTYETPAHDHEHEPA